MLKPGNLIGTLLEPDSMAMAIEQAMLAEGVFDAEDDTPEAAEQRRKALVAIAKGVVAHLRSHLEIVVVANKLAANLPAAQVKLLASANEVL
jgi:hypothetical protein